MLPAAAVVDPELTYDLPPAVTAATGLDALAQLIEPYLSARSSPLIDPWCLDGIGRVARSLPVAVRDGSNAAARSDMAFASLLGGLALANAALGAVHGFAGPIGGRFTAPHGAVCAALLPHVLRVNVAALTGRNPASDRLARADRVAQLLTGRADARASDGVAHLDALRRELGIPGLAAYGLGAQDVPGLVAQARRSSSMRGNPVELTDEELTDILSSAILTGTIHDARSACSHVSSADQRHHQQRVAHGEPEQSRFVADEARRRARDGNRLRRDHLPGDAARRVGRDRQQRIHADALGRHRLQPPEHGVGRRVRPGHEHAEPAEDRREQRKQLPGAGQRHAHRGRHARRVPDVGEAEHRGDGDERRAQRRRASPRTAAGVDAAASRASATDTMAAITMAVPVAESQLKAEDRRRPACRSPGSSTAWWISGNGSGQRQRDRSNAFTGLMPQAPTSSVRTMNGAPGAEDARARGAAPCTASRSPSKRKTRRGFHTRRNATRQAIDTSEDRMSGSSGPR